MTLKVNNVRTGGRPWVGVVCLRFLFECVTSGELVRSKVNSQQTYQFYECYLFLRLLTPLHLNLYKTEQELTNENIGGTQSCTA